MRLLGFFLTAAGIIVFGAGVFIGLPFTSIYLVGFLANAGREAGRELAMFLPATLAALAIGFMMIRIGRRCHRS